MLARPDNLRTSQFFTSYLVPPDLTALCFTEEISKKQLSLGIVQSCSVLLFLNDEVSLLNVIGDVWLTMLWVRTLDLGQRVV